MQASLGSIVAVPAQMSRMFGELMLKGVDPAKAARFASPGGTPVVSNHPVFVFGHLALYNRRIMACCDKPEGVTALPAGWEDLFKAGVDCKDDPAGTIYPPLASVTKHYFEGFDTAVAAVRAADDGTLSLPNPNEGRSRELFPLRAQLITFLLGGHPMSHFGQVSAWRRMMGLPSAM